MKAWSYRIYKVVFVFYQFLLRSGHVRRDLRYGLPSTHTCPRQIPQNSRNSVHPGRTRSITPDHTPPSFPVFPVACNKQLGKQLQIVAEVSLSLPWRGYWSQFHLSPIALHPTLLSVEYTCPLNARELLLAQSQYPGSSENCGISCSLVHNYLVNDHRLLRQRLE